MIASDESSHRIVRPKRHDGSLSRWRQIVPVHPMRSAQITQFGRKAALVGKLHGIMLRMAEAETGGQCRFQWLDCGFITSRPILTFHGVGQSPVKASSLSCISASYSKPGGASSLASTQCWATL